GERMAVGNSSALIGYLEGAKVRWFSWRNCSPVKMENISDGFSATGSCTDADAGQWEIEQTFTTGPLPGTLARQIRVAANRDLRVAYLPLLTLFPGLGTFETNKAQPLLAGAEFLENEPSSS